MAANDDFDPNQGHGDHVDCISAAKNTEEFLSKWLPESVTGGELICSTAAPVACDLGDDAPKTAPILYIGKKDHPRFLTLIAVDKANERNLLMSGYPEYDGAEVEVKLRYIYEWADGIEATLEGEVLGEAAHPIIFFDTRYAMNKGRYEIGKTYTFRISAFAYNVCILPETEREFRFEGDKAVEHRKRMGYEQEYDQDGKPKPVIFNMEKLVAYLPKWGPYPDNAEFQSPVFGEVEEFSAFDTDFYRINIAVAREDSEVVVPLIVKKSFFATKPCLNDPIRGVFWLQGYCLPGKSQSDPQEDPPAG